MILALHQLRRITPNAVSGAVYGTYTARIQDVYGNVYGPAYGGAARGATRGLSDLTLMAGMVSNITSRSGPSSRLLTGYLHRSAFAEVQGS